MNTDALLSWFRANARPLPWRERPDPYAVWLSEIMAQQTRIETMLPYWRRFLERWPTVNDLAQAPLDDVLSAWSGLGYYTRARNLHAGAQALAARGFPSTAQGWMEIPGVGRYTAGAVASIAFNADEPLVDGNVERVLTRWHYITDDARAPATQRRLWELARGHLPPGRAGDWNQALMELGATLCSPRRPRCELCPLSVGCGAYRAGDAESLPNKPRKGESPEVRGVCGAWFVGGRVLLARRPDEGLLGGLWELPGKDLTADEAEPGALARAFEARLGLKVAPLARLGQVRHIFTHRKLTLGVWLLDGEGTPPSQPLQGYTAARLVAPEELGSLGISTLARRALELVGFGAQTALFAAQPSPEYKV